MWLDEVHAGAEVIERYSPEMVMDPGAGSASGTVVVTVSFA